MMFTLCVHVRKKRPVNLYTQISIKFLIYRCFPVAVFLQFFNFLVRRINMLIFGD